MKVYKDSNLLYFYDTNIKLWTITEVDAEDNQIWNECGYYNNKTQLLRKHPDLKFTPYDQPERPIPSSQTTIIKVY